MFDIHRRAHEDARSFGISPRVFYDAGVAGALCDEAARARLRATGESFDWEAATNGT